jgi:CheY-like chemotaxis protein
VAAGYVVRAADDGLDAIGKLRAGLPDLIISDLNMPGMSGVEFLKVVRKRFPQIPVIVLSGVAADEMPAGVAADAYCCKNESGFEPLLQTISDLTRKPALRTALPQVDNKPVSARWDENGHFITDCEDCLREFSVGHATAMGRDKMWTICVHCGGDVRYRVAEHSKGK